MSYIQHQGWKRFCAVPLFAVALLTALPTISWAESDFEICSTAVTQILKSLAAGNRNVSRNELIEALQRAKVPAFLKQSGAGEVPVVLMNKNTFEDLRPFVDNSMGTQLELQPGEGHDHGLVRVTDRLIDVDNAGERGYGELHETGIAWLPMKSYLPRRTAEHNPILEVAYALKPEEKQAVEYYHRARRAAVFRVKFTFGGGDIDETVPNLLSGGGEHCFTFCKASALDSHIREIESKLSKLGQGSAEQLLARPDVQEYLKQVKAELITKDPYKKAFDRTLATEPKKLALIQGLFPAKFTQEEKEVYAAWLVGLDSSRQYKGVMRDLGVSGSVDISDMRNPRATAILVYDAPGVAKSFKDATYSTEGNFYHWRTNDQRPLPRPAK